MEAPSKNIRGWMGLAATVIATPVGSDLVMLDQSRYRKTGLVKSLPPRDGAQVRH